MAVGFTPKPYRRDCTFDWWLGRFLAESWRHGLRVWLVSLWQSGYEKYENSRYKAALFEGILADHNWCTRRMADCLTFLQVGLVDQIKVIIFNRHPMQWCSIRIFFTHAVNQTKLLKDYVFKESAEPRHRKITQAHFSSFRIWYWLHLCETLHRANSLVLVCGK